ncbi:hypothetical protein BDZ97DRAFT_1801424 [Flammula alnicola]|nr:hypothetical protein BDZ97DRAFT_1801424 [Flammula alnicola]
MFINAPVLYAAVVISICPFLSPFLCYTRISHAFTVFVLAFAIHRHAVSRRKSISQHQRNTKIPSKALYISPSPYQEAAPPYEPKSPMPPTPAPFLQVPPPSYSPV